ncbi:MAG: phosphopantothenoylcysteine decarboxylase [Phycisphaerae bacterium]|nr:phosphopantothenoylcysteine decarboxylase [Phycisphaerae bacterium]
MRILVTAGPTREHIDTVRFITNASGGRMGCAVAAAAAKAGHDVTLLLGPTAAAIPEGCDVVPFVSVDDLKEALEKRFDDCDALVMAAAVGDFRMEKPAPEKLRRSNGPITLRLLPTEDILAALARKKRKGRVIVAFAVKDGPEDEIVAKARAEMAAKGADYTVANTPAAMAADSSRACIISRDAVVLPWADRPKDQLAAEIVKLFEP